MKILMNATPREIERLGGDFSLYRDWLQLSTESMRFSLLSNGARRFLSGEARKAWEKSCRRWEPEALRRRLFVRSRLVTVPPKEAEGSQLLFSHLLYPFLPGRRKVPIVWSSQGISPSIYYERANPGMWTVDDVGFMYGVLGKSADILLVSTESGAQNLMQACPNLGEKVRVVHGPIFVEDDLACKPSEADGEIRFLFVGLDAVRKGLSEVLKAFRQVKRLHHGIRLDVVSRPPRRLEHEIDETSGAKLHWSSPNVNVKRMMRNADVFLVPTHADTYVLAAAEAMANGCAVIISDLEPLPEVVPEGVAGFCVRAGDVGGLVEKMNVFVSHPNKLRLMQESSRRLYRERHHPNVVAAKLAAIFEGVLSKSAEVGTHR